MLDTCKKIKLQFFINSLIVDPILQNKTQVKFNIKLNFVIWRIYLDINVPM